MASLTNRSKIWILLAVLAMLHGCSGCRDSDSSNGSSAKTIKLGAILPLSGSAASYGQYSQRGIDLAVEEINAAGGVNGKNIEIDYQDDRAEVKDARDIMIRFGDSYPVVIGPAPSSSAVALAPIAARNKVVLFSPIASSPELSSKGGEFFYRVCPSDAYQSKVLAEWVQSTGHETVAIMFINNSWGASLKDEFVKHFEKLGGKIATIEACKEDDRDFRTQIAKMKATGATAFFVPTYGQAGGIFVKQAKEQGVEADLFGGDVWGTPEFQASAGPASDGCRFTVPAPPSGEKFEVFAEAFKQKYNAEPEVYSAYSYDLVKIVANAIRDGSEDGPSIKEYLDKMPAYEGVTGITKFDENNDVSKSFVRRQYQDGEAEDVPELVSKK